MKSQRIFILLAIYLGEPIPRTMKPNEVHNSIVLLLADELIVKEEGPAVSVNVYKPTQKGFELINLITKL